jgi:hypothetical protein
MPALKTFSGVPIVLSLLKSAGLSPRAVYVELSVDFVVRALDLSTIRARNRREQSCGKSESSSMIDLRVR